MAWGFDGGTNSFFFFEREHDHGKTDTYSVDEAAKIIGISRVNAYVAVRGGKIPAIRLGKRFFVPKVALERWLASAGTYHAEGIAVAQ